MFTITDQTEDELYMSSERDFRTLLLAYLTLEERALVALKAARTPFIHE